MTTEISGQSQQVTFPNPLRQHNYFVAASAAALGVSAIVLLFACRPLLQSGQMAGVYPAIVLAILLLSASISFLYQYLSQLRFLFGRGRPESLAPTLKGEEAGRASDAEDLKEILRQQSIPVIEPQGPIAGLLYTLVPNLLYAPWPLRRVTEYQFRSIVTLAVLLFGLLLTLMIGVPQRSYGTVSVSDWVGVVFLAAAGWSLVLPQGRGVQMLPFLTVRWMTGLVVFAVLGPILLSLFVRGLPPIPFLSLASPYPHVFIFLLAGLILQGIAFAAIVRPLPPEPPSAVTVVQDAWDMSALPASVSEEFRRAMQESWREKVPNRRYAHLVPEVVLNIMAGSFRGEVLEETQPFPLQVTPGGETPVAPSGSLVLILTLEALGLLFIVVAAITGDLIGMRALTFGDVSPIAILYLLFSGALGAYALRTASTLRLRFDFGSRLIWLELSGQYVAAHVDGRQVVAPMPKIDGMTFRLWVADLHTVCFGKDEPRHLVSMDGNFDVAQALSARLKMFAKEQTAIASIGNPLKAAQRMSANQVVDRPELGTMAAPRGIEHSTS